MDFCLYQVHEYDDVNAGQRDPRLEWLILSRYISQVSRLIWTLVLFGSMFYLQSNGRGVKVRALSSKDQETLRIQKQLSDNQINNSLISDTGSQYGDSMDAETVDGDGQEGEMLEMSSK